MYEETKQQLIFGIFIILFVLLCCKVYDICSGSEKQFGRHTKIHMSFQEADEIISHIKEETNAKFQDDYGYDSHNTNIQINGAYAREYNHMVAHIALNSNLLELNDDYAELEHVFYHEFGHHVHTTLSINQDIGFMELFAESFSRIVEDSKDNNVDIDAALAKGKIYCDQLNYPVSDSNTKLAKLLLEFIIRERFWIANAREAYQSNILEHYELN